jgi:hypothetical protein
LRDEPAQGVAHAALAHSDLNKDSPAIASLRLNSSAMTVTWRSQADRALRVENRRRQ